MPAAETARLIASLELQDKNFTRGIKRVEQGVGRVDKKLGAFSGFVNRNMARAIDSIGLRLVTSVSTGLEEMATLEDAATSVAGAIKQVGPSWTTTADDIVAAANRIESETDAAFDDKAIVAATETLIRYGKVSEKNLEPAMLVMTDLAARTGDVESAATLLGKALADPEKAAGKLARSGVVLTKQQQKQIKAMVKAGDVAGAQSFLLAELEKTTKGAAAASAGPYRDALNKLGDAGEDLRRGFVTGLAPAILEVSDLLTSELAKPSTIQTLKDVGKEVGGALKGIIGIAKTLPWDSIGNAMKLAGTGAKAILDAFLGLPPWVQTAVLTGWGLNKITGGALTNIFGTLASGLIKGVLGMNAGVVNINAAVVNGAGGVPGAVGKGGGALAGVGKLALGITGVGIAAALANEFSDEIFGLGKDMGNAWRGAVEKTFNVKLPTISMKDVEWPFGPKNTPTILPEVFGGNGLLGGTGGTPRSGGSPKDANFAEEKAQRRALDNLVARQATTNSKLNAVSIATREGSSQVKAELGNVKTTTSTGFTTLKAATDTLKTTTDTGLTTLKVATAANGVAAAIAAAGQAVRDSLQTGAIRTGASQTAAATRNVSPPIVGALASGFAGLRATIWAARPPAPIIQSTTVVQKYSVSQRGGATSDSRTRGGV
jgi:hypothetical protein